jgi:hypothetical protein
MSLDLEHDDDLGFVLDDKPKPAFHPPDMSLLVDGVRAAPDLPLEHFGAWGPWIVDAAAGAGSPPDYVALGLLTSAAVMIGASRSVSPWPGYVEPCAIWGGIVGSPSVNKSPAINPFASVLTKIETEEGVGLAQDTCEWEGKKAEAELEREKWEKDCKTAFQAGHAAPKMPLKAIIPEAPQAPRLKTSDATVEALGDLFARNPKGVMFYRDELGRWLANFNKYGGGGEAQFFLERFNGGPLQVDRVKAGRSIRADRALMSVLGTIQPDVLSRLLLKGEDEGFAARFLFVWPSPIAPCRPKRVADFALLEAALRALRSLQMSKDDDGKLSPSILSLDDKAGAMFEAWMSENYQACNDASGKLASWRGKARGFVLRIALILAFLDWAFNPHAPAPETLSGAVMARALGLVEDYFAPMAERVFGDACLDPETRLASSILKAIAKRRPKTFNPRDARETWKLAGLSKSEAWKTPLALLVEGRWLIPANEANPQTHAAGRPRSDYLVNPHLWEV